MNVHEMYAAEIEKVADAISAKLAVEMPKYLGTVRSTILEPIAELNLQLRGITDRVAIAVLNGELRV